MQANFVRLRRSGKSLVTVWVEPRLPNLLNLNDFSVIFGVSVLVLEIGNEGGFTRGLE